MKKNKGYKEEVYYDNYEKSEQQDSFKESDSEDIEIKKDFYLATLRQKIYKLQEKKVLNLTDLKENPLTCQNCGKILSEKISSKNELKKLTTLDELYFKEDVFKYECLDVRIVALLNIYDFVIRCSCSDIFMFGYFEKKVSCDFSFIEEAVSLYKKEHGEIKEKEIIKKIQSKNELKDDFNDINVAMEEASCVLEKSCVLEESKVKNIQEVNENNEVKTFSKIVSNISTKAMEMLTKRKESEPQVSNKKSKILEGQLDLFNII